MILVDIPGRGILELKHIVLDYNGTMAKDGILLPGVEERLNRLSENIEVHILTADTFGKCRGECKGIKGTVRILAQPIGAEEKETFVESLGADQTAAVGNGANDRLMLAKAALGIVVLGPEGTSVQALQNADVAVKEINEGLDLLLQSKRLIATLRL
ncbi:HAD family hydrolase [Desulfotruncus alcoholivorax]|uniref:HAD family hydrolase n=1 Tax=Desulfotruncus alcoholivorax TaxID=265477 RepID=UPI00041C3CEB|nr:HAD family hydrolase [Desulfotruncus alcoholivorax]